MKLRCQPVSGTTLAAATLAGVAVLNVNPGLLSGGLRVLLTAAAQSPGPTPPFASGCRLVDPPELTPSNLAAPGRHTLKVDLTAQPVTVNVSGSLIKTHVYNKHSTVAPDPRCFAGGDVWIPPTLRVDPGDDIRVKLTNAQTDTGWHTNLHFHGLHVSPGLTADDPAFTSDDTFVDVSPIDAPPGHSAQQYAIAIPDDHPIGTYWYHGHFHPEEPQIFAGESGLIEIGDLKALLPAPLRRITSHPNALKPFSAVGLQDTVVLPQSRPTREPVQCPGDPAPTTKHYGRIVLRTTWRDFIGRTPDDPQGRVMLDCHIAGHFDNGMLTWFEVVRR